MSELASPPQKMVVFDTGCGRQAVDCSEVASVKGGDPDIHVTLILKSGVSVVVKCSFDEAIRAIDWQWRLFKLDGQRYP